MNEDLAIENVMKKKQDKAGVESTGVSGNGRRVRAGKTGKTKVGFRHDREIVTPEERIQRAKDLPKRMEKIIASIRKSKD